MVQGDLFQRSSRSNNDFQLVRAKINLYMAGLKFVQSNIIDTAKSDVMNLEEVKI